MSSGCRNKLILAMLVLFFGAASLPSVSALGPFDSLGARRRAAFQEKRAQLWKGLAFELQQLADHCHQNQMPAAAVDITAMALDLQSDTAGSRLPEFVQLPVSSRLPPAEQAWRKRVRDLREDKAKELYMLARQALNSSPRQPTLAYDIVLDVLRLDPDHTHARAVLGHQVFHDRKRKDDPTYAGEWVSPFEAEKRSGIKPEMNHPIFGWIPEAHAARYAEGLRPWRGQWVSKQKEAELRRDFRNAWEIRTEHFLLKTNVGHEEGVRISRQLEIFHDWLHNNFAAFFDTPEAISDRFAQVAVRRRGVVQKPMEIHYYNTQEEYESKMRGKVPPGATNGVYWEPDMTSYFFRNPKAPGLSTVFHEATHQILDHATRQDRVNAARRLQRLKRQRQFTPWVLCANANFWMIEGLACYLESFEISEGVVSVGRPEFVRFVNAQQRLLHPQIQFFEPLERFCGMGQKDFQQHPQMPALYSQASGVAHFLLHYEGGIYRDDFVNLLSAYYRPDLKDLTKKVSLEDLTGVPFARLDQQYRTHIEDLALAVNRQAAAAPAAPRNP